MESENSNFLSAIFELENAQKRFDGLGVETFLAIDLPKRQGRIPKTLRAFSKRPFSDVATIHSAAVADNVKAAIFCLDVRTQYGKEIAIKSIYFSDKLSLAELKAAIFQI
jgi:hypothetical protein